MSQGLTENDPNSFARPDKCVVTHLHLEVDVLFDEKILSGFVDFKIEKKAADAESLILDTQNLTIKSVSHQETGEKLQYALEPVDPIFGTRLEIKLPNMTSNSTVVRVEYETSPNSSALQWLSPEQTSQKTHPYLYSHCEAIHARAMLPCQDTPGVKTPYTAAVKVPKDLTVLMSALREGESLTPEGTHKVARFNQKIPIPIYLIAIVVGAIESRKLGPRSHVWAEKEYLDKAVFDFSETEAMLKTAEELLGPYVWGVYDLLVLPPSFPYGGMENPCLTFVTPTLLAGDKSLANVIAHEISHSWTGNLITNINFEHFWLNEGFTMFVERKILGKLYGEPHRHFSALDGWKHLQYDIDTMGPSNALTKLVPNLVGVHPDDSFSSVPYEKGHTFLFYLEQLLDGADVFNKFLRSYIEKFSYQSIDTNQWKTYLFEYFQDKADILNKVDWDSWLYSPGMPPVRPEYDNSLGLVCQELVKRWLSCDAEISSFQPSDIKELTPGQIQEFLSLLLQEDPLPAQKVKHMTELYRLDKIENSEIRFRWLRLGLRSHWEDIIPHVVQFLGTVGRMKFTRPLFRDLHQWEEKKDLSIKLFNDNKPCMMHVVAYTVSKDLNLTH